MTTGVRRTFNAGSRVGIDQTAVAVAAIQRDIATVQTQIVTLQDATNFAENETPTGVIDGVNDTFTLAHTPIGPIQLFKGAAATSGLMLQLPGGAEYTLSGRTVTYAAPAIPVAGERHRVWYRY